jgi:hypothetical protein
VPYQPYCLHAGIFYSSLHFNFVSSFIILWRQACRYWNGWFSRNFLYFPVCKVRDKHLPISLEKCGWIPIGHIYYFVLISLVSA